MRSDVYDNLPKRDMDFGLNPTLIWICALTNRCPSIGGKLWLGLNPTLIWICALTSY